MYSFGESINYYFFHADVFNLNDSGGNTMYIVFAMSLARLLQIHGNATCLDHKNLTSYYYYVL